MSPKSHLSHGRTQGSFLQDVHRETGEHRSSSFSPQRELVKGIEPGHGT